MIDKYELFILSHNVIVFYLVSSNEIQFQNVVIDVQKYMMLLCFILAFYCTIHNMNSLTK